MLDLFREWDTNGDGEVSRSEFQKAVVSLGLNVPKSEVDKLFDEWDTGRDGALAYKELSRILKVTRREGLTKATGVKAATMAIMDRARDGTMERIMLMWTHLKPKRITRDRKTVSYFLL